MRLKLLVRLFIVSGLLSVAGFAYSMTDPKAEPELIRDLAVVNMADIQSVLLKSTERSRISVQTDIPGVPDGSDQEHDPVVVFAEISAQERLVCREPMWDENERYLLASIAMAEAGGEDIEGKALIICVVINRVRDDRFPDSVEEVIYQKHQFTPVSDGRFGSQDPDEGCWEALDMILSDGWDNSRGALYFERESASQWHRNNLKYLFRHGNHTFYTEKEE